ncbi:Lactadherin [Exaiptasia diaphana]|nr:Lactadherin [Exaiptasia diaphana]
MPSSYSYLYFVLLPQPNIQFTPTCSQSGLVFQLIIATNLETGNLPVFIPLHPREIVTRQIRIHPRTGVRDACMRLEIYGCLQESPCSSPVGMKSHRIPAESIAASSVLGDEYRPTNGRLGTNTGFGAWCAAIQNDQQFLLIDLGFVYKITGIATQGKYVLSADDLGFAGVQSYKVDYSQYGIHYSSVTDPNGTPKIFLGNGSQNVTATHTLDKAFKGRFVKFRPLTWHTKVCMRVELYGCKDCFSPLGMEDGRIPNNHILGNHWSNHADPNRGRFNHPGYRYGYTYLFDDLSFIEVQFPDKSKYVSAVAVEGTESGAITAYTVSYSPNGADWLDYKENGETKVNRVVFLLTFI